MFSLLRYVSIFFIFFAYYMFYILTLKGKSCFFLSSFIAFVSIVTYIFGIINLLNINHIVLFVLGIILFIISVKDIKNNYKDLLEIDFIIYILISVGWLFFMTRNTGLSHWDDFSHWYRIAKVLHFDNSFPITNEILYTTYLPGSACFIYFITKFITFNVPNVLFAQGLIIIGTTSCLLSIFKNNIKLIYKILIALIGTICLCSITSTFYVLIVDALVGMLAFNGYLLIKNNNSKCNYFLLLLICTYLPLIKASGILFTIILSVVYAVYKKEKKFESIIILITPLALISLYLIRNCIIYLSINNSNQAISLSRFIAIGSSKDSILRLDIIKNYSFSLFNIIKYHQVAVIWLSLLILFIINIKTNDKLDLIVSTISFISYSFCLLLVYMFSMDISEANGTNLACFDRYIGTIAIFLFGIAFSNIANQKLYLSITTCVLVLFISLFNFKYLYSHYVYEYTDKMWVELSSKYEENVFHNTTNYLVVYDKNDYPNDIANKAQALCSTYFRSEYVFAISTNDIKNNNISNEAKTYLESSNEIIWLTDSFDLSNLY